MPHARKLPSGNWQGIAKQGRVRLGSKTFKTRRDAISWAERTETAAAGGQDVRAGRATVKVALVEWVEHRRATVAPKTATTDAELLRLMSPALGARAIGSVTTPEVERWLLYLRQRHQQGDGSIRRYRGSLSALFAWAVADHRIASNPVTAARPPRALAPPQEMRPLSTNELHALVERIAALDPTLADVVSIAAWTGMRWAELRAVLVGDLQDLPTPAVRVVRSQPEGHPVKTTKSGKGRRVPLPDVTLPAIRRAREGKGPNDLLLTTAQGGQLWAGTFRRRTKWATNSGGRRIHDLRHTAACSWLSLGVDPGTVQAWMGHASITTTERYLHYLGTDADAAGLARLNAGGAHGAHAEAPAPSTEGTDA